MKTYKEWQQAGYHVIRGRKASGRNERGECVFAAKDVEKEDDYDDDDYDDYGLGIRNPLHGLYEHT